MRIKTDAPSVNVSMTPGAKANEIIRRVIEFIAVNVVNVKVYPPSTPTLTARLARPFVSIFYVLTNGFPVVRVIPFSNTALPGWVFGATNSAAKSKRLGLCANRNIEPYHEFTDGGQIYPTFRGNIVHRSVLLGIFDTKPISVFVKRILAIVTVNVCVPAVFSLVPCYGSFTAALAKWRIAVRNILDGLASLTAGMSLPSITHNYIVLFQNVLNSRMGATDKGRNSSCTLPRSIWQFSCVEIDNHLFGLSVHSYLKEEISD